MDGLEARGGEATERKQEARRKLRDVLRPYAWQEWTRRHIEVPCTTKPAPGRVVYPVGRAALSPLSMRDEFILKRARALCALVPRPVVINY